MSEREHPLERIRYRGDAADGARMQEYYRIGHYLQAYEDHLRRQLNRSLGFQPAAGTLQGVQP